jgi:sulfotransferase
MDFIEKQKEKPQFVCLSGLPRTGSTLLSAILGQNPKIHAEGNSAVCQLLWDMYCSCTQNAKEQLLASNRSQTLIDLMKTIPQVYYKDILETETIIVDKCRSWTLEANVEILKTFINPNIKIIVLERPVIEIVKSFSKLCKENGRELNALEMLKPMSEPLMRSISGIQWAKKNNENNNFIFIQYQELVDSPKETIDKIYEFLEWEPFEHDFENIVVKYPENDEVYQLQGQHVIREKISKIENDFVLSQEVIDKCTTVDKLMGYI